MGALLGLLFALVGLAIVAHGLAGLLRNARVRKRSAERPHEPWYWDHPWDRAGARHGGLGLQVKGLVGLLLLALFLAPFHWFAFESGDFGPKLIVGVFDLVLLAGIVGWLYELGRWLRWGESRLRFGAFPFLLGGPLNVEIEGLRGDRVRSVTVTLRCVEEAFEMVRRSRSHSTNRVACFQVWADTRTLSPAELGASAQGIPLAFALPDLALPTRLRERPPRYWEVDVRGEAPGIDYRARFLVPVYGRRA